MSTAEKLRQEGRLEGRLKGKQEGRLEGIQEGRQEVVLSLVHNAKKQGFSAETISKIVDLDITLVKRILNHEEIEVPLHLLDSENKH